MIKTYESSITMYQKIFFKMHKTFQSMQEKPLYYGIKHNENIENIKLELFKV